ncbi:helix-turn-helix domain-containing protein [Actinophytocola xanthii]|nr:helix-turn-helix transcriptional regulator [Actinophytocola xanthii]
MTATPPPSPATAIDDAALVAQLRRLKAWSGLSFRQLERRAAGAGDTLPYSTAATMLGKSRLPREDVVAAFVRACGVADVRPWLVARARIADRDAAPPVPAAPRPPARWRRAVAAAAALAAAFAGGAVFDAVATSEAEVEVQVIAP